MISISHKYCSKCNSWNTINEKTCKNCGEKIIERKCATYFCNSCKFYFLVDKKYSGSIKCKNCGKKLLIKHKIMHFCSNCKEKYYLEKNFNGIYKCQHCSAEYEYTKSAKRKEIKSNLVFGLILLVFFSSIFYGVFWLLNAFIFNNQFHILLILGAALILGFIIVMTLYLS